MNKVITLFFRRMRMPLLVLLGAYSISIGGLVLIPGTDAQGNVWHFDFFNAFYFVSYMASTIGFGELPHEFNGAQRMWTVVAIYLSVISWLYAIGTILSLIQDPTFRRALAEERFRAAIRRLKEPFYLVCGFGQTGRLLVQELANRGIATVVVDNQPTALQDLELTELPQVVPHLLGDASDQRVLRAAGLEHPRCRGVLALTRDDHHNLQIAVAAKLLHPTVKVVSIAHTPDSMNNMGSFDTDHIVNPFYLFADQLARALRAPNGYDLYQWLLSRPGEPLVRALPPPRGNWILCGYGRFGKAVKRYLEFEGVTTTVLDPDPLAASTGVEITLGRGTEARDLREAGIREATALVAGADDDANNLSILMTAKMLKPALYTVARENRIFNHRLYQAAQPALVMQSSRIVVRHILALITTPLLDRFLKQARHQNEEWATALLDKIEHLMDGQAPESWDITVSRRQTPAIYTACRAGIDIDLGLLSRHPRDRDERLNTVALMLSRGSEDRLLPEPATVLKPGDRILFCGRRDSGRQMEWVLNNRNVLEYLRTGASRAEGLIWRWLSNL